MCCSREMVATDELRDQRVWRGVMAKCASSGGLERPAQSQGHPLPRCTTKEEKRGRAQDAPTAGEQ